MLVKLEWLGNCDDMLSHFHLIPERNGQTDGRTDRQTDRFAISISRVCMLTRDKNSTTWSIARPLCDSWASCNIVIVIIVVVVVVVVVVVIVIIIIATIALRESIYPLTRQWRRKDLHIAGAKTPSLHPLLFPYRPFLPPLSPPFLPLYPMPFTPSPPLFPPLTHPPIPMQPLPTKI